MTDDYRPLYHGIRTNKTADQITRDGLCVTYRTSVDAKIEVINALRYFGKEKLLTSSGGKGSLIRNELNAMKSPHRRNIWATTEKDSVCEWWANANPEHISQVLQFADVDTRDINKYLNENYGKNCLEIELKMNTLGSNPNFNTGLSCISPDMIASIRKCKSCIYTGASHTND